MTEAELLYHLSETFNRLWSLIQWWASISFALILVAHLTANKLNILLLSLILFLYCTFSFVLLSILGRHLGVINAIHSDLEALSSGESKVTNATEFWVTSQEPNFTILAIVALGGTFLGVIAYLIYRFFKSGQ